MVLVKQALHLVPVIYLKILIKLAYIPCFFITGNSLFNSKYQGCPRQGTERLVMCAVVAGGDQAGVLNLFVAPQHAQGLAMAGE